MPNSNDNNMFSDNSLDLARMYGFDPYNVNSGQSNPEVTSKNNNDILNQIYNDEANEEPQKNENPKVDPETGKLEPLRPCNRSASQTEISPDRPPAQGSQTFPTQHGDQTSEMPNSVVQNNLPNENIQPNNMQNINTSNQSEQANVQKNNTVNINIQPNSLPDIVTSNRKKQEMVQQNMPQILRNENYNENRQSMKIPNNLGDINSFMRTQIGKDVVVQSIVGTDTLVEKSGVLLYVGDEYIILNEDVPGNNLLLIEIPTIRFIRFES